ncbi:MAG: SUMF1/EgtB/PvdO family nonheme iron enzyme [Nitrospirota bacterium]
MAKNYFLMGFIIILFISSLIFFKVIVEVTEQWIDKFLRCVSVNVLRYYDKSLKQYLKTISSKLRQEIVAYSLLGEKLDLEKSYIRLKLRGIISSWDSGFRVQDRKEVSPQEVLSQFGNIILITGESGSGKTTLLKHLAYLASSGKGIRPIPVFITITEWMETNLSLIEYIFQCISQNGGICPLEFIENKLAAGKFLILLDGFDEELKRQTEVKEQILTFANQSGYKNNKIVITSKHRISGLTNLNEFEILELNPLQQRLFLESMIIRESDFDFERCSELIKAIEQNHKIAHLTKNPLLLTLVYIIFKYHLPLPQRQIEVYELCINLILKDNEQQIEALKNLAWYYHTNVKVQGSGFRVQGGKEVIPQEVSPQSLSIHNPQSAISNKNEVLPRPEIEPLLKEIEETGLLGSSGIICKEKARLVTDSTYRFTHLSFQEYLVAKYINDNRKNREKILLENLGDYRWTDVILFYAAMIDNPSNFIKKVLGDTTIENQRNVLIAGKCLFEVESLNEETRGEVLRRLIEVCDGGDKRLASLELFDKIFGFFARRGEPQRSELHEESILIQGLKTVRDRELRYRLIRLLEKGFTQAGSPDKTKELFEAMKDVFVKDTDGNILYFAMQILEKIAGSPGSSQKALAVIHSFKGKGISQVEIQMALIPAGRFLMGSLEKVIPSEEVIPQNEGSEQACLVSEQPVHEVYLDLFYMDKTPVTNAEYEKFDPGHKRYWENERDDQPVVNVSWYEAYMYAFWVGRRLPSEAEWEKVARGTDARKYPWGSKFDPKRCNTREGKIGKTTPVRKYNEISPYGCIDMAGNVLEWCADWYDKDYYKNSPDKNPKGADKGIFRVARGGSWYLDHDKCQCSSRFDVYPSYKGNCVGFRCAKTL